MARPRLLVDAGGLVAIANARDHLHQPALSVLAEFFGDLVTTWPAVTEACQIVPTHLNAPLLDKLAVPRWQILGMSGASSRLAELIRKYADRPMDLADASMVWAAEQTGACVSSPPIGRISRSTAPEQTRPSKSFREA